MKSMYGYAIGAYVAATIAALILWYLIIGINKRDDED